MDDYDRENLNFLLNADKETLLDWYETVGEDDHEYASELLALYGEELEIKAALIKEPKVTSIKDASKFLSRFKLNK